MNVEEIFTDISMLNVHIFLSVKTELPFKKQKNKSTVKVEADIN